MIQQLELTLQAKPRGFHLITNEVSAALHDLPETGMISIFIQHTSAGLTINENADPTVRADFESFMNYIVPEGKNFVLHDLEGEDDMPAHIKSSLVGSSVTIPVKDHRLFLGTWQGIYLCEFRNHPGRRKLVINIYS